MLVLNAKKAKVKELLFVENLVLQKVIPASAGDAKNKAFQLRKIPGQEKEEINKLRIILILI